MNKDYLDSVGRCVIITDDGVIFQGFNNLYEIFGFVELKCSPNKLRRDIMEYVRRKSQKEAEGNRSSEPSSGSQDAEVCDQDEGRETDAKHNGATEVSDN